MKNKIGYLINIFFIFFVLYILNQFEKLGKKYIYVFFF